MRPEAHGYLALRSADFGEIGLRGTAFDTTEEVNDPKYFIPWLRPAAHGYLALRSADFGEIGLRGTAFATAEEFDEPNYFIPWLRPASHGYPALRLADFGEIGLRGTAFDTAEESTNRSTTVLGRDQQHTDILPFVWPISEKSAYVGPRLTLPKS